MFNFKRSAPPFSIILASLILWGSFAWGLPADAPVAEGEADAAAEDVWAGVRISDAYDELRCPYCSGYNELTAARCPSCGYEFPQPSAEVTDADMVFVPGKGYYREGTVLEPGKSRKRYWVAGIVLAASGLTAGTLAGYYGGAIGGAIAALPCLGAIGVGVGFIIYGLVARAEPLYAFEGGELYKPYEQPAFTLSPPDSDGVALKVEVTLLRF